MRDPLVLCDLKSFRRTEWHTMYRDRTVIEGKIRVIKRCESHVRRTVFSRQSFVYMTALKEIFLRTSCKNVGDCLFIRRKRLRRGQLFQKSISNEFPQMSRAGFSQLLVSNIELVSNMKVND